MNIQQRSITDVINNEYKEYAMYVIENRAIPSYIDGLKPSSKKLLYSMINYYKGKKIKNSELGASIASVANYHHGNVSAENTIVVMGAKWNNHVPLFQSHGNFGSRIVPVPSSSRYIFSSLSEDFGKYFCDDVVCNKNLDPDNPEPQQYLPNIPFVLVNGVEGIAVGYACNYLPHTPKDIAKACLLELEQQLNDDYTIPVTFPHYQGLVTQVDTKTVTTQGIVKKHKRKNTWEIFEVQWGVDREKVFKKLSTMMDNKKIDDFDDLCDDKGFHFLVKLTDEQNEDCQEDPIQYFGLTSSFKEIYIALDEKGELIEFNHKVQIVKRFVNFRLKKIQERIDYDIQESLKITTWYNIKRQFIQDVIDDIIVPTKMKRDELIQYCIKTYQCNDEDAKRLVGSSISEVTTDQIASLDKKLKQVKSELKKFKSQTPETVYRQRLEEIINN